MDRFPAGHLVIGLVPEELVAGGTAHPYLELLTRLLARLVSNGLYALAASGKSGRLEIHCVFEREIDARRFAEAVSASIIVRLPGWKSQREFLLDRNAVRMIERILQGGRR